MTTYDGTVPALSAQRAITPLSRMSELVRLMRPHQWVKNVAVLLVPAMTLTHTGGAIIRAVAAAVAFCCASSAIYVLNDYLDIERDRLHPVKCLRPLPSGSVSRAGALCALAVMITAAIGIGLIAGVAVIGVLGLYGAINIAYCLRAKHVPVLDILCVSSGFVLRVVAGAFAVSVVANPSLLGAVAAGSFALVAAKRRSELSRHRHDLTQRPALAGYSIASLDQVLVAACIAAALLYFTSIASAVHDQLGSSLLAVTLLIALAGVLRLLHVVQDERNRDAEDPARMLAADPVLRVIALLSLALAATTTVLSHAANHL